jgi:hypothetical protein
MDIFFTELADEFKAAFAAVGTTGAFNAYLGQGPDSTTLTREDGLYPREMWWWRDTEQGREIDSSPLHPNCNIAYDNLTGLINAQVRIGYPEGSSIQQILYITPNVGMRSFGNQSPLDQKINAAFSPPQSNLPDLRTGTTSTPPLSLLVTEGNYIRPSTESLMHFAGATLTLSSQIGALTSGQHRLGLICLDPEPDALVFQGASAVTASGSLPARDEFSYAHLTAISISTYIPLGAVYLYNGQTSITEDDLLRRLDPRVMYYAVQVYVRSVAATAPLISSGGRTPTLTMDAQPFMRAFIGI